MGTFPSTRSRTCRRLRIEFSSSASAPWPAARSPSCSSTSQVDPRTITIMDFEPNEAALKPWLEQGHDVRQGPRHAGEPGHAARQASVRRRPAHRPGLEHRLLRDRAVVPRSRRALHQHVGRAVGSLRRRPRQTSDRAHALLAAHESAAADRKLERAGADRRARARRQSRPDHPFHQAGAARHRPSRSLADKKFTGAQAEKIAHHARAQTSTTWPTSSASRSSTAASATRRSPTSPRRSTNSSTPGASKASARKAPPRPRWAGARTRKSCPPTPTSTRRPREPDLPGAHGHQHLRASLGAADYTHHRHGRPPRRGLHHLR